MRNRFLPTDRALFCLLLAVSFLTRFFYMYRDGMPDPDSVMIAAGVALGATGRIPFAETFLYGRQLNPGVFLAMKAAYPALWHDPRSVATMLNWIGVCCGTLTLLPLRDLFRIHLSSRVTLLCLAIWAFAPLVWESQTSFHPLIPATFFFLGAISFARRAGRPRAGWFYFAGACIFASAAFLTRTEVVVVLPAIAVFALGAPHRKRALLILVSCSLFALVAYAIVIHATAGQMISGAGSMGNFWDRYRQLYGMGFSLAGVPRSLAWACMGLGIGTLCALLVGLGWFLVHREKKLLVFGAIVWTLPSIVFWLPYIVPILRHYYLSSIGLVWLAGLLVLSRVKTGRAAATTAALIVISLLVPEAAYHWYNDAHAASTKTPHGTFFYNHEVADARVKQLVELRNSVLNCTRSPDGKKKSIVLCRWDVYANVVYGIASQGTAVTSEPQGAILPEIGYAHYVSEKADVQLIRYVYMENDDVRRTVSGLLVSARQEGDCVFVPASIRPFDELQDGVTYYR